MNAVAKTLNWEIVEAWALPVQRSDSPRVETTWLTILDVVSDAVLMASRVPVIEAVANILEET